MSEQKTKEPSGKPVGKIYPNNYEAEQSLLACLLIDKPVAESIIPLMSEDLFYNDRHRKIYKACRELFVENKAIDFITVNDKMESMNIGEPTMLSYLSSLTDMIPSAANYKEYYDILLRDMRNRQIIGICNNALQKAYQGNKYTDTIAELEEEIYKLNSSEHRSDLTHISEASGQLVARIDALCHDKNSFTGLKTGFPRFDAITHGLQKGSYVVLAARPSVGKTSFALNILSNIATQTEKEAVIAFFSLEMPSIQLAQRVLSGIGTIPMNSLSKGTTVETEQENLISAHTLLSNTHIFVDDTSMISPSTILSKCRRLYTLEKRLDLIVIDYLQLMMGDKDKIRSSDTKQNIVTDISRMMKIIAKEMNCPVLVLSQMSRGIEERDDKTPKISDLRESGAIEQDADIVLFLSRENENEKVNGRYTVFLDIAKNRNGELGTIRYNWEGQFVQFTESSDQYINREIQMIAKNSYHSKKHEE